MRTFSCCLHCAVRVHTVWPLGSPIRDDHPHPCILCTADERGQQEVAAEHVKLTILRAA